MLYHYFDKHADYKPSISNPFRSKTTIVIDTKKESGAITKKLAAKGFIIAQGYKKNKETQIRIGNFPAIPKKKIKKTFRNLY